MRRYFNTITGSDPWNLRELCERYLNDELWQTAHMTAEQAASAGLDHFKAAIASRLNALDVVRVDELNCNQN